MLLTFIRQHQCLFTFVCIIETDHYLIATDEAGYGPKLGPLVVVGSLWKVSTKTADPFAVLRQIKFVAGRKIAVGDSKKIFKPGVVGGLVSLRFVAWTALRCCGYNDPSLRRALESIAAKDIEAIASAPWLANFDDILNLVSDALVCDELASTWSQGYERLVDVRSRILTAKQFNAACNVAYNKSDLLSATTLGIVDELVGLLHARDQSTRQFIDVFCDRHGGRRFYAAVLQHTFADSLLTVESETATESVYRLTSEGRVMRVRFTVKGDSFAPVALSSMIAKFLRECAMRSLNEYFSAKIPSPSPLRPSAGYPVDADRFLAEIAEVIRREKIKISDLVRSR